MRFKAKMPVVPRPRPTHTRADLADFAAPLLFLRSAVVEVFARNVGKNPRPANCADRGYQNHKDKVTILKTAKLMTF
jgi:hypothetical protein